MLNDPEVVQRELQPGEWLRWSGRPGGGLRFRPLDAFTVPFVIGFGVFVFSMGDGYFLRATNTLFGQLYVGAYLVTAVYMLIVRFILDANRRTRTWYGLTDRRVLIATNVFGQRLRSIDICSLGDLTLRHHRDGTGTIVFQGFYEPWHWWSGELTSRGSPGVPVKLEFIPDADGVYAQLRAAQEHCG